MTTMREKTDIFKATLKFLLFILLPCLSYGQSSVREQRNTHERLNKSLQAVASDFKYSFRNLKGRVISEAPRFYETKVAFETAQRTYIYENERGFGVFCIVFAENITKPEAENLYEVIIKDLKKCHFKQFYLDNRSEVKMSRLIYSDYVVDKTAHRENPLYDNFAMQLKVTPQESAGEKWTVALTITFIKSEN